MKYIKLFENFDSYDPYELMMVPPNKQAEMINHQIRKPIPNMNLVQDLIVLGANLDWQDELSQDRTPLHLAIYSNFSEIVRMLIDAGANLNVQDKHGDTPLHVAIMKNNPIIVQMLIDAGADLNMQDIWNRTPLHWAVYYGKVEIVRMLIDAGARKDILDYRGRLPYDLADTEELKNLLKP
jgi:ankyrin repeat protein